MNPLVQRYFGTAIGKGRQGAKTEVERLKLGEITCEQGVTEIAKMCAVCSIPDLESFLRESVTHMDIPSPEPWPAYMSRTYLHHIFNVISNLELCGNPDCACNSFKMMH